MAVLFSLEQNFTVGAAELAAKAKDIAIALDNALHRGAIEIADAEKQAAPKWRTELANSILVRRNVAGDQVGYDVVAVSRHGVPVDQGSKGGGWAPLAQIIRWMDARGIVPQKAGISAADLARLIRLRIGQRGNKAHPFWEQTYEAKRDRVTELARTAVANVLGRGA